MRHFVTTEDTVFAIPNADGTLIYGTCPAGCNISTGQPVCELSVDGGTYYDLILAAAVTWVPGEPITDIPVTHDGEVYQSRIHHIAQSDWPPDIALTLFHKVQKPTLSGYPAWEQRFAAPYYRVGDMVTHKDQNWECTAADANGNNVWEPGAYGWVMID